MPTTLFRVTNQGLIKNSILIDKIDQSQGNSEGYAQKAKQAVYVPLLNPLDKTAKGYLDMIPTDEVLLSVAKGTIAGLVARGILTVTAFSSALTGTPTVSASTHLTAVNQGGQSGAAATISAVVAGVATLTGLTGMVAGSVGRDLTITGAATGANNGTFRIVEYVSATSVKIRNAAAVFPDANSGSIAWQEKTSPRTTITGTLMASLAPDVTRVTITNLSNTTQVITDSAIIAAGAPNSFGTSAIVIQDALVTIGTPTTGWKVTVTANSKASNTFTLTLPLIQFDINFLSFGEH